MEKVGTSIGTLERVTITGIAIVLTAVFLLWASSVVHPPSNAAAQGNPAAQRRQIIKLLDSIDKRIGTLNTEVEKLRKAQTERKK